MQPPPTPDNRTAQRFRLDDLDVDIGKAEVSRKGEKIALPKLSFDLLMALIEAAPSLVTNEDLLQQVWPGLHVSPESVAQRVKLLRSALGDDSQQPRYILGVRGRGYRLIPSPEAVAQEPTASPQPGPPRRAGDFKQRLVVAAAVVIGMAIVLALGWRSWYSRHSSPSNTVAMADRSIAVLPFVDMSEKQDQEYFGDGMAEQIIDLLVKVPGLRVIGRTSSFQFKKKTLDLRSIAAQLGAANILEGSVRKSGDRIRVTAQLIDSRNGTPRWSQTYDRDFSEVLRLQDEIATKVAHEVEADALFSEIVTRKTLRNTEAYTAFLQGMHSVDSEQQVVYFQQALDLDPTFADAASVLASAYLFLGQSGGMPASTAFEKARATALLALKLDPAQSTAHKVLGDVNLDYDWDWRAAEREYQLATALAFQGLGSTQGDSPQLALTLGRWDEALKIANKSVVDDPLDPQSYLWLGVVELRRGRLPEAEAAMRRSLELSPEFRFAHYILAVVLLSRGEPDIALVESSKEPLEGYRLVGTAMAYFALGEKAKSDEALAPLLQNYAPYIPSGIAAVYAFRGDSDEAFKWLNRAYTEKDPLLYRMKFTPEYDKLHDDARFKTFLTKMNLPL